LEALALSKKCGGVHWLARSHFYVGEAYDYRSQVDSAERYYRLYLYYARLNKDSNQVAEAYNFIGSTYIYRADYPTALTYCVKGLKLAEDLKNDKVTAASLGNIGNIYFYQRQYDTALDHWKKSLVYYKKTNTIKNIVIILGNIGAYYNEIEDFENALKYLNEGLEYTLKYNDKHGTMSNYINIGNAYFYFGKAAEAMSYYTKATALARELEDKYNLLFCLIDRADCSISLGRYGDAERLFKEALALEREFPLPQARLSSTFGLFKVNNALKKYPQAIDFLLRYKDLKDSILSTENQQQINELQTRYQTDKKEQENKLLQAKNTLSEETIKNQKLLAVFLISGIALALLSILAVYRSYRLKKKDNIIITAQKQEVELKNSIIEHQKAIVEEKQKEVLDSIHYAKRIQNSLLPGEKYIERTLARVRKGKEKE